MSNGDWGYPDLGPQSPESLSLYNTVLILDVMVAAPGLRKRALQMAEIPLLEARPNSRVMRAPSHDPKSP